MNDDSIIFNKRIYRKHPKDDSNNGRLVLLWGAKLSCSSLSLEEPNCSQLASHAKRLHHRHPRTEGIISWQWSMVCLCHHLEVGLQEGNRWHYFLWLPLTRNQRWFGHQMPHQFTPHQPRWTCSLHLPDPATWLNRIPCNCNIESRLFGASNGYMFCVQGTQGMTKLPFLAEQICYRVSSWGMVGQAITSSWYSLMMSEHTSQTM